LLPPTKPKPYWPKRLDLAIITALADATDPANLRNNGRPITASADPAALGGDEGEEGEAAKERDVGEVELRISQTITPILCYVLDTRRPKATLSAMRRTLL
jgi:hypothetical protein